MSRKKVLMACPNYWSSPFQVGSNHLARYLCKTGWEVAWISDPISPFHIFGGRFSELKERFDISMSRGEYDLNDRLWHYVPFALISPHNKRILRSIWIHLNWHKLTIPELMGTVKQHGFDEVDLIFLHSSSQGFWLNKLKHKKSILRISDKNTGFKRFTLHMEMMEKELAREVDLVIYTAESLKEYIYSLKPKNILYLPNGVNFSHFQGDLLKVPEVYKSIPRPIAVYVGSFESWFDFDLIKYLAEKLSYVSFVLIGPDYNRVAYNRLHSLTNVHLLGGISYNDLPKYLRQADIGLIPFNVKTHGELINYVNPVKLYEYLASGLPVVAVEWKELKHIGSPAKLCQTPNDFVKAIKEIINNPMRETDLLEFARRQDWSERFKLLMNYL